MLRALVPITVLTLACLPAGYARAGTVSASITVSATVVSTCSVGGSAVAFGAQAPGAAATQQAALTVNCSPGTAYQLALNDGLSGDAAERRMAGPGGATLAYDLYRDGARSLRWRDGADAAAGVGTGEVQTLPVYAALAAGMQSVTGSYSDTVTATLSY